MVFFLLCRIEGRGGACSFCSRQVWDARGCWVWLGTVLGGCVELSSFSQLRTEWWNLGLWGFYGVPGFFNLLVVRTKRFLGYVIVAIDRPKPL